MAFLLPIAAIASTALGVYSSIKQGKEQSRAAKEDAAAAAEDARRQAEADLKNAARLRTQAVVTRQQVGAEEDQLKRGQRRDLASIRGSIAESGFTFSDTMRDLQDDADVQAELDVLNLRYQGEMEARSIESDADSLTEQAGLTSAKIPSILNAGRRNAKLAKQGATLGVISSVIGGVANYAGASQSLAIARRG